MEVNLIHLFGTSLIMRVAETVDFQLPASFVWDWIVEEHQKLIYYIGPVQENIVMHNKYCAFYFTYDRKWHSAC